MRVLVRTTVSGSRLRCRIPAPSPSLKVKLAVPKRERLALVYAREPMVHLRCDTIRTTCALPPLPLQHLAQRLVTEVPPILVRKLTYGEVRLLLAGALLAEGDTTDLYHCLTGSGAVRLASHLALLQLLRRLGFQ